jgi:hypothetical protein
MRATGQHRRPHRSVAAATPAQPPSPPQLRCPHHHITTAAARAHHHHCHAHTVDATTAMRTPPPPSTHHHHIRRHRVHTTTVAAQNGERAGGEKEKVPSPHLEEGEGRSRAGEEPPDPSSTAGKVAPWGIHQTRRGGAAVGPRASPMARETRRAVAAGSTATTPRPAAAPRHQVRGERRGEEGAARLPSELRERGRRRRYEGGGGGMREAVGVVFYS